MKIMRSSHQSHIHNNKTRAQQEYNKSTTRAQQEHNKSTTRAQQEHNKTRQREGMAAQQGKTGRSRWPKLARIQKCLGGMVLCCVVFSLHLSISAFSGHFTKDIFTHELSNFKKLMQDKEKVEYHIVFSTGCSLQQNWESYVFFYHAFKVKQPGNVTRLISGCTTNEEVKRREYFNKKIQSMSENFHIHFTPDYSRAGIPKAYKYNNKPNSLYHWMVNVLHMNETNQSKRMEDAIIMLMDPDMVLLRPLLHDFSGQNMIYTQRKPRTKVVRHGYPMAQQDGYLNSEWLNFNRSYITQSAHLTRITRKDGDLYWNSGPPYLATVRDMYNIVRLWKDYVPRVYEEYPQLFAEMYGYIYASWKLDLPHSLVKSIVVSSTKANQREGWGFVDALPDDQVCNVPNWTTSLPIGLHYCQRYLLGKFFFSKYRLKKKFITCKAPLLTPPPKDIATRYDYWVRPPPDKGLSHEIETQNITKNQAKREAFMLCGLISSMNDAARYFKLHNCDAGIANFSETYNFHDDPHS